MKYTLENVSPGEAEYWREYHKIRREVLWETRGRSDYHENHPDELTDGHYPMVFCVDGIPVGVVRIDLDAEIKEAIFRRVAITPKKQRKGLGRRLMEAAEKFALECGYETLVVNVAVDAIPFYERLGYTFDTDIRVFSDPNNPRMIKKRIA